ncbi:MAG: hypothetical protein M0002_08685 [Rhodospirillales bacterium]|nr:hypothetical protein [Rhodospirillales bacterium]
MESLLLYEQGEAVQALLYRGLSLLLGLGAAFFGAYIACNLESGSRLA